MYVIFSDTFVSLQKSPLQPSNSHKHLQLNISSLKFKLVIFHFWHQFRSAAVFSDWQGHVTSFFKGLSNRIWSICFRSFFTAEPSSSQTFPLPCMMWLCHDFIFIGTQLMNRLSRSSESSNASYDFGLSCGIKCKFMWDGFGRWQGKNWKPYLRGGYSHSNGIWSEKRLWNLGIKWRNR